MRKTALFLSVLALGSACSNDSDNQDLDAPVILSATLNGEDHDLEFNAGEAINLAVEVSDNEALGQLKLDLHDQFDGHSHGKLSSTWTLSEVYNLSGSQTTFKESLQVPDPVTAGPHHLILRLLDAAGNESEFTELDFVLRNGSEPQISITDPDFSQGFQITKGQSFNLTGSVTDNIDLAEIVIQVREESEHSHKSYSSTIFSFDKDLDGGSDLSFDLGSLSISIPSTAEIGHYELYISAKDSEGNYGIYTAEIEVI
ncbi:DUF4625 domain-containing protein [Croceimicrobium hydrocarbonivorans]|uniref:DUF4625 domain-containing protein n=1 Tax=Croceimicrobium hydrocarbonivorans TaxID=2761580 RepID=A0A7H0VJJ0_9FLAO|nr:DUF4625 domain-containing protein [Croceimicrobium hydrocarbonivorans]QNR25888.1 DUF4625 domain-containing protein [Croceimicrobium hydrocarbonivorans]